MIFTQRNNRNLLENALLLCFQRLLCKILNLAFLLPIMKPKEELPSI